MSKLSKRVCSLDGNHITLQFFGIRDLDATGARATLVFGTVDVGCVSIALPIKYIADSTINSDASRVLENWL